MVWGDPKEDEESKSEREEGMKDDRVSSADERRTRDTDVRD